MGKTRSHAALRHDLARPAAATVFFALLASHSPALADSGQLLSARPERAATATQFEARPSSIAPTIDIAYSALADAANAAADRFAGPRSGHTRIGCQRVSLGDNLPVRVTLFDGCADFDWNVTASRNGSITVKRAGDGIAMDVPVKFTGQGSLVGKLARAVQTGNRNFSGTFVVTIQGAVKVDKSFCPKVENATAQFAWGTAPDIDVIGRSCLDAGHGLKACIGPWKFPAGSMMTNQINGALQKQVDDINGKIPCDQIRNQLKTVWKTWSIPVPVSSPPIYVNIQPKALSVAGVTAADQGIQINARLDAGTSVSMTQPPATPPPPLPENTALSSPQGRFALAVPLTIPYPLLSEAGALRMGSKEIRAGKSAITPMGIEIFPNNNQLAVGVTFRNDTQGRLRGETATVWYTAAPTVDNNGHAIRLGNLAMTHKLDNRLWPAVAQAVDTGLPKAVGASYGYDFSGLVQDARTKLDQAIADPKNTGGVKISLANDDLHLGRTAILPDSFVIEGLFNADATITLETAPRLGRL
jgi:hypothetical protein